MSTQTQIAQKSRYHAYVKRPDGTTKPVKKPWLGLAQLAESLTPRVG